MPVGENHHRDMADTISRLFWENFIKSEPAFAMRDVIAIELDKARAAALDDAWQACKKAWDKFDCKPQADSYEVAKAIGAKACMAAVHALKPE